MNAKTLSTTLALLSTLSLAAGLRAAAPTATPPAAPNTGEFDAERWSAALRQPDLEERRASYEELLAAARLDDGVLAQVREWSESALDVELAWTAQLMLRELEAGKPSILRRSPLGLGQGMQGLHAAPFDTGWVDELLEQLGHGAPFSGLAPFQAPGAVPHGGLQLGPGSSSSRESSRFSMGPDGVKLEVEETVDGETVTKTYEAESLEELLEIYPELEGKVDVGRGLGGLMQLRRSDDGLFSDLIPRGLGVPHAPGRPSLDMLGIRMVEPANRTVDYPGVDSGVGLQVMAVVPGTLADAIGIRRGELVVSIAGEEITSAADVKRALASQSLEGEIEVECVEPDGTRHLRHWTPPGAGDAEGAEGNGDLGRRLRKGSTRV